MELGRTAEMHTILNPVLPSVRKTQRGLFEFGREEMKLWRRCKLKVVLSSGQEKSEVSLEATEWPVRKERGG